MEQQLALVMNRRFNRSFAKVLAGPFHISLVSPHRTQEDFRVGKVAIRERAIRGLGAASEIGRPREIARTLDTRTPSRPATHAHVCPFGGPICRESEERFRATASADIHT
jgi:hypothetical protein